MDYWGQSRRYDYTLAGHLRRSVDPLGRAIHHRTDPLGRIVEKALPDPDGGDKPWIERFAYDANGNLIGCANPHIRIERRFDPDGRLIEEKQGETFTLRNAYDEAGNRIARHTEFKRGDTAIAHTVRYAYDALDQAIEIAIDDHAPIAIERDAAGQIIHERLSPRLRREVEYSADGYLTRQRIRTDADTVVDLAYDYDAAGNLIERHDRRGALHLRWDANQRLIESRLEGVSTRYRYDPLGRRIEKRSGDTITTFAWDGDALAGDWIEDPTDPVVPAKGIAREWVYYPETFEPLALLGGRRGPNTLLHDHNDPNGCPIRLTDSAGEVLWAASYTAWGQIARLHVGYVDNPIRLQGQYEDGETGLRYNRARYYCSGIGAFVSADPIALLAGTNLYAFAPSPLKWIDPLGLSCTTDSKSGEKMVDLFRAVGPEELEDILRTRSFRPKPGGGSLDAKQFARDLNEAIALADHLPDTAAIVRARVPANIVDQMDLTPVDRTILRSGSVTVQPDKLDLFNSSIIELEHVY